MFFLHVQYTENTIPPGEASELIECETKNEVWECYDRLLKKQRKNILGDIGVQLLQGSKVVMDPVLRTIGNKEGAEYCRNKHRGWSCVRKAGHEGEHRHPWRREGWK